MKAARFEFFGFIFVGVISSVCSLVTRYIANQYFTFEIAVALSHVLGMLVSFGLSRQFIFPVSNQSASTELLKFSIVNIFSLLITTGVSSVAYRLVLPVLDIHYHTELASHIAGLAACTLPSYYGHKYFSFKNKLH